MGGKAFKFWMLVLDNRTASILQDRDMWLVFGAGAYLATKCQFVYERANNLVGSVKSAWRREAQYGKYLTPEEMVEHGGSCAICQVSTLIPPLRDLQKYSALVLAVNGSSRTVG